MKQTPNKPSSPFPAVDSVLRHPAIMVATAEFGRKQVTESVRQVLAGLRSQITKGSHPISVESISGLVLRSLEADHAPSLKPIFNLTGTVLHTNLGRAVMPDAAVEAVVMAMRHAVNLEYDLETGKRGERDDHIRSLICELTGAEDCVVVNNNAAAVLLVLSSLSAGKETLVSRGELIEIGGSFRIPDIMRRAGAKLCEVGTTNRTHASDYADAITPRTAAIMKVHTSNYRIQGFTSEVLPEELASLARQHNLPLIDDLGSGTLIDLSHYGLKRERTVQDAIKDGANLVTFSGDKLLGGPQVGIIAGRRDLVRLCAKNHLKRALRADKLRIAALAATLKLYRDPDRLPERLPTLQAFTRKRPELSAMAAALRPSLQKALGSSWKVEAIDLRSQIGSGAMPLETLDSAGLSLTPVKGSSGKALDTLAKTFRLLPMPIIGRIHGGSLLLDLRCLNDAGLFSSQCDLLEQRLMDNNA